MPTIRGVIKSIGIYSKKYQSPECPPFDISQKYDLFPPKNSDGMGWPGVYPYAERQGVYLICDKNERVLYIGKASFTNTLGNRLSSYFMYGNGDVCSLRHDWTRKPRYIVTVATPSGMAFMAPSLEEYLITRYRNDLPDQTQGAA